ncbi:MAG: hypothetical protein H6727_08820 [Myxococcales bacterium]|nr:hypothetical protein [Myxococcales bacterium]
MKAKTKTLTPSEETHHPIPEHHEDDARQERTRQAVYTIIDQKNSDKGYWLRIGTAFFNRDNSLTVYLNALPTNNRLHIRDEPTAA